MSPRLHPSSLGWVRLPKTCCRSFTKTCVASDAANVGAQLPDFAISELGRAIAIAGRAGVPITVLGGGSNVLVSDEGFDGRVVQVGGRLGLVARTADTVTVGQGLRWRSVGSQGVFRREDRPTSLVTGRALWSRPPPPYPSPQGGEEKGGA